MGKNKEKFTLSKLKINPKNPFPRNEDEYEDLVRKIEVYPKFLELRPIIYDPKTMIILGGNKRYAALQDLGYKEIPINWVKSANDLTEQEKKAFVFADNKNYGTWVLIDDEQAEIADEFKIDYVMSFEDEDENDDDDVVINASGEDDTNDSSLKGGYIKLTFMMDIETKEMILEVLNKVKDANGYEYLSDSLKKVVKFYKKKNK